MFIANGSNTNVKVGPGVIYGGEFHGANGATLFLVDSLSIGATPNYVTQVSNTSNIAVYGPALSATTVNVNTFGARFQVGLTVATTSNANASIIYD